MVRSRIACWSLATASILALVSQAAPVFAQAAASDDEPKLETVIVTGDRSGFSKDLVEVGSFRGARVLDTPQTISVIPQEVLQSQQALDILDALRNTSGVTQSQTSTAVYNNLAIRGIVVNNRTNFRLNGSLPVLGLIDIPLEDKDRVEALKGASSLYYGFVTPGGIINFTMKRPTQDLLLNATIFGQDTGGVGMHLDIGDTLDTPIGSFGARVNGVYAQVDSGINNTQGTRSLASGAFDFKPTDYLTFSLDLEHIYKALPEPALFRYNIGTGHIIPSPTLANPYPQVALPALQDPTTNFGPTWARNRSEETNGVFHADWKISDQWDLSGDIGASGEIRNRHLSYLEPLNLTAQTGTLTETYTDQHYVNETARTQLAGVVETGPFIHNLLFGVSTNQFDQYSPSSTTAGKTSFTTTNVSYTSTPNIVQPAFTLAGLTTATTRIDDVGYYIFDRITWEEYVELLGGVRFADYTELDAHTHIHTFHATPTLFSSSLVLKPVSWVSAYGSYIEGLTTTAGAPANALNAGVQLPPTPSKQRELGVKLEPMDGLLIQTAYFAIQQGVAFVNTSSIYTLGGNADYKGWEANISGEVTPDLSIFGSAQILQAKQVTGAATCGPGTTVGTLNGTCTAFTPTTVGNRVDGAPKVTYSLAGEYRLTDYVPGLAFTAGMYYTGNQEINAQNSATIPGFLLFDLGLSYHVNDWFPYPTTFRINAENVTDKVYFGSTSGGFLSEGPPPDIKFSIETNF